MWTRNALGGMPSAIDPGIFVAAGSTIGATLVDLLTWPEEVARARAEFNERTGGGVGGSKWVPPLLPGLSPAGRPPLAGVRHDAARRGVVDSQSARGGAMTAAVGPRDAHDRVGALHREVSLSVSGIMPGVQDTTLTNDVAQSTA